MSDNKLINKHLKTTIFNIKRDFGLKQSEIADQLGVKSTYLSDMINGGVPITENITKKISEIFHIDISENTEKDHDLHLIPFYDDVSSMGGTGSVVAGVDSIHEPAEYVDASVKTTEIYLKKDWSKVDNAVRAVIDFLNKKEDTKKAPDLSEAFPIQLN